MGRRTPQLLHTNPRVNLDLFVPRKQLDTEIRSLVLKGTLESVLLEMENRPQFLPRPRLYELVHQIAYPLHNICSRGRRPGALFPCRSLVHIEVALVSGGGEGESIIPVNVVNEPCQRPLYCSARREPVSDEIRRNLVNRRDCSRWEILENEPPQLRVIFALLFHRPLDRKEAIVFQ